MQNLAATARLLVVSRDSEVLRIVWMAAQSSPWQLIVACSAWEAMEKLQSDLAVDVLLIDLAADDPDGLRCLPWLRRLRSGLPILLIDRMKQENTRLHAIRVGSNEYLVSPLAAPQLEAGVVRCLSSAQDAPGPAISAHGVEQPEDGLLLIGASPKMHRLTAQVALLAANNLPALISGEQGTEKATIARLMHELSARSGASFAKLDCASLSEELLEQEIFGCEQPRGVRTARNACGELELIAGGTLLLEEIAEMPLTLQSKLAKVLESGRFSRTGGAYAVEMDVRVIASSSLSIDRATVEHRIVPELSRQFGDREVRVPPLREREEEIPLLARYFMRQLSRQFGFAPKEFPSATEEAWQSYPWPGNLRELKQVITQHLIADESTRERKSAVEDCASVTAQLPSAIPQAAQAHQPAPDSTDDKSLRSMVRSAREEAERAAIASALETTGWNRKAAARLLKVSYRSILYKIEQYQMSLPRYADPSATMRSFSGRAGAFRNDREDAPGVLKKIVGTASMEPAPAQPAAFRNTGVSHI